jgi:LuxR family transcriptional regulator, quorum-sensing system regulator BjaR1
MSALLRTAFDLLEGLDQAHGAEDLGRRYFDKLKPFGFGAIFARAHALDPDDAREHIYYRETPKGWDQVYSARGFAQVNFVTHAARRTARPFIWSEAKPKGTDSPLVKANDEMWDVLHAFGLEDGVAVPSHTPSSVTVLSLATFKNVEIPPDRRKAIVLSSHYVHDRLRELEEPPFKRVQLTPRERDCLAFAAEGKSDWDIGQILGIAQSTVHAHVENAKRKLRVKTRMQAVAKLARAGEL